MIDTVKRAQLEQIVNEINTIQLKCDTVSFELDEDSIAYRFKGIYFDKRGQLRKYLRKEITRDGTHSSIIMFAYYNENGELVYIFLDTSFNCGDGKEFYYIYKGNIVDFTGNVNCDCCEDGLTQEEINLYRQENANRLRPVIGNPLKKSMNWELNLTNFIHAEMLLEILQSESYYGYEEF